MNELKLMAIKAKSRLLNKGLREIYSNLNDNSFKLKKEEDFIQSISINDETERKRQLLNKIKNKI